jgi:hypothetical protein
LGQGSQNGKVEGVFGARVSGQRKVGVFEAIIPRQGKVARVFGARISDGKVERVFGARVPGQGRWRECLRQGSQDRGRWRECLWQTGEGGGSICGKGFRMGSERDGGVMDTECFAFCLPSLCFLTRRTFWMRTSVW